VRPKKDAVRPKAAMHLQRRQQTRQRGQVGQVDGHEVEGDARSCAEAGVYHRQLGVPLRLTYMMCCESHRMTKVMLSLHDESH